MAANKFATMLHRNTHRITAILVYAILEWILILFLLLNSFLSYLIFKFADYFGLTPPCLLCCRVDHIIQPSKASDSFTDLLCETHATQISQLGYCSTHRKLVPSHAMCHNCSSSSPPNSISLFSLLQENKFRCSCCDVSLDTKSHSSPYLLIKPSWGVLNFTQKGNLVEDGGDSSDPCKSDQEENGMREDEDKEYPSSFGYKMIEFDETDRVETSEQEPLLDEDDSSMVSQGTHVLLQSPDSSLDILSLPLDNCYHLDDNRLLPIELIDSVTLENENMNGILDSESSREEEQDEAVIDNKTSLEEDTIFRIVDETEENNTSHPLNLISVNMGENGTSPASPVEHHKENSVTEVCDGVSITLGNQTLSCNGGHVERAEAAVLKDSDDGVFSTLGTRTLSCNGDHVERAEAAVLKDSDVCDEAVITLEYQALWCHGDDGERVEAAVLKDSDYGVFITLGTQTLSCNGGDVERVEAVLEDSDVCDEAVITLESQALRCYGDDGERPEAVLKDSEICDEVNITLEAQTLSCNGDDVERAETVLEDSDELADGPIYRAFNGDSLRISGNESTYHPQDHETISMLIPCPQPNLSSSYVENEQGTKQAETVNEVEEQRTPETPTFTEGLLYLLHKKSLSFERKESGTEESLDGIAISEFENGEVVLTIERMKSALKAEHKALTALYAELEEERSASAVAANQTMAMITRLQEEKAAMQMEALQYQRMMEEQSEYDQEALQLMNELMVKREKEKQELEKELEVYRKKVLHSETKERRMRRNRTSSERSRPSSISSSNIDSDELSVDLNHEGTEEDNFYGLQESSNQKTPVDAILNVENIGLESTEHLSTLDESLAEFEEERLSILEQLKSLEEKLFTLGDGSDVFEDIRPVEDLLEENGMAFNEKYEFSNQHVNGVGGGFSDDMGEKHYQEKRNMGTNAKRLLPLFDAISMENEDEGMNEEHGSNAVSSHNSSISKFTSNDEKLAIEEQVDHVYERLQALEADREFLKHCISSLKKGDKGMDLLQEILQHLRDLRSVELRVKNMSDHSAQS